MLLIAAFFLLQALPPPFWEIKPPEKWSRNESDQLLRESPWARSDGPYRVYLSSAGPVRIAEQRIRQKPDVDGEASGDDGEYQQFISERAKDYIVVTVRLPDPSLLYDPREAADVVKECRIKLGKRKHKLIAHFPPTAADPLLRLVFPKKIVGDEKTLILELYLPGTPTPWRNFEFAMKDLVWKGKPEL